ncbi:hypothetical protein DFQ04_1560 [Algoriphagus boseongensis]|uniref:Uncharacterized protein n=1 Tax=Algoriphagus boseongensis TaxID=1442587 RepID=A0A4R6T5C9_9BACT|nr:hypothetical protein DFQ04_1560 [Algoriphagus boseongensis]
MSLKGTLFGDISFLAIEFIYHYDHSTTGVLDSGG